MKPKSNYTNVPAKDRCQTPPYALAPLLPHLPANKWIYDPAAGRCILLATLRARGYTVAGGELASEQEIFGENYAYLNTITTPGFVGLLGWSDEVLEQVLLLAGEVEQCAKIVSWNRDFLKSSGDIGNIIVTNPPYSIKLAFLKHCIASQRPFALLMPAEFAFTAGYIHAVRNLPGGIKLLVPDTRINFGMPDFSWSGAENKAVMLQYWQHIRRATWSQDSKKHAWLTDEKRMNAVPSAQFPVAWYTWGLLPQNAPVIQYVHLSKKPFYEV